MRKWKKVTKIIQDGNIHIPKFPTYVSNHGRVKRSFKNKNRSNFGYGEYNKQHKLTNENVYNIINLINKKYSDKFISEIYNVDPETIRNIRIGKSWNHITHITAPII